VKIKIDENMLAELALILETAGHDVDTVPQAHHASRTTYVIPEAQLSDSSDIHLHPASL